MQKARIFREAARQLVNHYGGADAEPELTYYFSGPRFGKAHLMLTGTINAGLTIFDVRY